MIGIERRSIKLNKEIMDEAIQLSKKYDNINMGGPSDINFIYNAVRLLNAKKVIETGVAYGWSSLAILNAFYENNGGLLYSVDMPYPKRNNENYIGVVVPERFRKYWKIIDRPDVVGIPLAIKLIGGQIDVCHYDSDKSAQGRDYAYPILWDALKKGGLFISDDIGDNLSFSKFAETLGAPFCVIHVKGKQYIGAIRKI